MAMSELGMIYLAASFISSNKQRQVEVVNIYNTWLDTHGNSEFAQNCLMAAARSSRDPRTVAKRAEEWFIALD